MLTSFGDIKIAAIAELTKHDIRTTVWNYLEESKLARFPTPVHNRIPNFEGAVNCGQRLAELPLFASSNTIKVDPDKPLEEVRFLTLKSKKRLLVPPPRLKTGLFNILENEGQDNSNTLRKKSVSEGMKRLSKPLGLESKIKVDLIVLGATAVSVTGRRIGKGEGYSDLEYAMIKSMGAVDDSVPIVAIVHDCQVFDDLPSRLFMDYDVPVDVIVTPTQVIQVAQKLPRPKGLYWHLLSVEKFLQIPVIRTLYEMEKSNNVDVRLLNGEIPPDQNEVNRQEQRDHNLNGRSGRWRGRGRSGLPQGNYGSEGETYGRYERGRRNPGRRGRGSSRGGGRDEAFNRWTEDEGVSGMGDSMNLQYNENTRGEMNRTFERGRMQSGRRGRGGGRGRGRGGRRDEECDRGIEEENVGGMGDPLNIQVTINVNKQNKIVRRNVEATHELDRVGSALDSESESATETVRKSKNVKKDPTFAIFIGGIPRMCRVRDLQKELSNCGVHPSSIKWRGPNGFAFLNFHEDISESNSIVESLQGLKIRNSELKISLANDQHGGRKNSTDPNRSSKAVPSKFEDEFDESRKSSDKLPLHTSASTASTSVESYEKEDMTLKQLM